MLLALLGTLTLSAPAVGVDAGAAANTASTPTATATATNAASKNDAPCADRNPLKNLYWGDLHVHTSYSLDAYTVNTRGDPGDAYRFARGEAEGPVGYAHPAKLDPPLNFTAVTDHSEFLNVVDGCVVDESDKNDMRSTPYCSKLRDKDSKGEAMLAGLALLQLASPYPLEPLVCRGSDQRKVRCDAHERTAWDHEQAFAEAAYQRCKFTTFKAYEWTAQNGRANLHRNVIFSGSNVPAMPADFIHFPGALQLWKELDRTCKPSEGCDVLTIPHNSNASYGRMWETIESAEAVPYMARYQTLVEIFQHKGNSECIPGSPLADPMCSYEIVAGSFLNAALGRKETGPVGAAGYVRDGLAQGLSYQAKHGGVGGINPVMLGIIGSTDTHNATPGNVREETWPGHAGNTDATPEGRLTKTPMFNPGGITGVWAEENTRESIFAALKRRETYGTSGPRIAVRFLVVPDLASDEEAAKLCADPSFPQQALNKGGVPMGGLFAAKKKPYLFALAQKDKTDLDSIDFVKLSAQPDGTPQVSVKRVQLEGAQQQHTCVYWSDPAFDASKPTLYMARVFEQPTWRWSHNDCAANPKASPDCDPKKTAEAGGLDVKIQERAWTSPVYLRLDTGTH